MSETTALYELLSFTVVARDAEGNEVELVIDGPLDPQNSQVVVGFDYQTHEPQSFENVAVPQQPSTSIMTISLRAVKHSFNAKGGVMMNARALGKHRKPF